MGGAHSGGHPWVAPTLRRHSQQWRLCKGGGWCIAQGSQGAPAGVRVSPGVSAFLLAGVEEDDGGGHNEEDEGLEPDGPPLGGQTGESGPPPPWWHPNLGVPPPHTCLWVPSGLWDWMSWGSLEPGYTGRGPWVSPDPSRHLQETAVPGADGGTGDRGTGRTWLGRHGHGDRGHWGQWIGGPWQRGYGREDTGDVVRRT